MAEKTVRERLEEEEKLKLSRYATLSKGAQREKEEKPCDLRTAFQRDRDRVIHSKAFRRLKHKTQVFIAPEGDHFRTRLTHTLEVAQIARTVARALSLNEDLAEAIAVGHDLGHTPFGHAGEEALNEVYSEGFHHNQQSLRIVKSLENGRGLNLTRLVCDGILHHTGPGLPVTPEGKIVRIADRVAYINHDIDDAIRAGIISVKDLPKESLEILGYRHRERINTMVVDLIQTSWDSPEIRMSSRIQKATDQLRDFLFDKVYIGSAAKTEEKKAKYIVKCLYNLFCRDLTLLPDEYAEAVKQEKIPRVVCDYVAGMSDRYALKVFEKYYIPLPWLLRL